MTQNHTTTTIERFLKSRYRNPLTNELDGLAVDENGDFLHYNTIIDQTYNELFKDMHLNPNIPEYFKKEFCKHFYNREIGLETFARFQILLESKLNNECFNLFRMLDELRKKAINDLNQGVDLYVDSDSTGDNQGLGIVETRPQDRKEIVFTPKYGVIEYANNLQENHGKYENEAHNHTHGWQGNSLFERLQEMAEFTDLLFQILNSCDELFLQVF